MTFMLALILGGFVLGVIFLVLCSCCAVAAQADREMENVWRAREDESDLQKNTDGLGNSSVRIAISINFPASLTAFQPRIRDLVSDAVTVCSDNFVLPEETPVVSAMPGGQKQTR